MTRDRSLASWNKNKIQYDLVLWAFNIAFLLAYILINKILFPDLIFETIIIRSFGILAIALLHVILSIGPLARLNQNFLPLLYNRRHLGVSMFIIASVHAVVSIFWFHGGGNENPILSIFTSNTHYDSLLFFPFETLGFVAFLILILLAATSNEYWLKALTPKTWKALHMLIYLAYFLLMMHVVLGVMELENNIGVFLFLMSGMVWLMVIHIMSGLKEWNLDNRKRILKDGWVRACEVSDVSETKAKIVMIGKERVALFKHGGKLSAINNVCKHQLGPLGEGKIIDDCIVCPWHGTRYHPQNGISPDSGLKVSVYRLNIFGNTVYINPKPVSKGDVAPIVIGMDVAKKTEPFFIGRLGVVPSQMLRSVRKFVFATTLIAFSFLFIFAFTQRHISKTVFDASRITTIKGTLLSVPFPCLRYLDGRDVYGNPQYKILPLAGPGKSGADNLVNKWLSDHGGKNCFVAIKGNLLDKNGTEMLLLTETNSIQQEKGTCELPVMKSVKDTLIPGEIIDPRCYLGYMNPAEGKPHRECAIRCISGGIMPMLVWKAKNGTQNYAVLLGKNGKMINEEVLYAVGEPVRVRGVLHSIDNWYWMEINPEHIRRAALENF